MFIKQQRQRARVRRPAVCLSKAAPTVSKRLSFPACNRRTGTTILLVVWELSINSLERADRGNFSTSINDRCRLYTVGQPGYMPKEFHRELVTGRQSASNTRGQHESLWLLAPATLSALAVFGMWTQAYRMLVFRGFFEAIGILIFMLSPLFVVYTIWIAVRFSRKGNKDAMWVAILLLLPQLFGSLVSIGWLLFGQALQT